jgi:hypothetical protein
MDRDRDGVVDAEDVAWAAWRGGLLCEEAEVAALLEEVSAARHFEPGGPVEGDSRRRERERHSLRDGRRRVRTFGSARVTKAQLMAWEWPWAWKPGSHTATRRSSGPAGPPTGQSMPSVRIHGPATQATRRRGPWRVSAYQTPSGRRPGDGCGGVVYYTWVWYVGAAPRCGCVRWASTSGGRRQRCIQLCGVTLP